MIGILGALLTLAVRTVLSLACLSVLIVAVLRFVAPPVSALMLERTLGVWVAGQPLPQVDYQWRPYEQISSHLALAAVAAEDQKFVSHAGFDLEAIAKAQRHNAAGGRLRGGSTITQQVAKNLFLWSGRSYLRKGLEAYFAVLIEALWPKQRTLEMYLNIVELGDLVFGAEAASLRYFGKPARDLGRPEAALLAASLPNPHAYRVAAPSSWLLRRQQWILRQMDQLGGAGYLAALE